MRVRVNLFLYSAALGGALAGLSGVAEAAEGFRLRYNLTGSLGPDLFAPPASAGWLGRVSHTYGSVHKVTGDGNGGPVLPVPGGTVALPAPTPAALHPRYSPTTARIGGAGSLRQSTVALAYVTPDHWLGGRLAFGANVAYVKQRQTYTAEAPTPSLAWPAGAPAALRGPVDARFGPQYQAALAAQATAGGGEQSGPGDAELSVNWIRTLEEARIGAGLALALPTGEYDPGRSVDAGLGDFYTLRPSVQAAIPVGEHYVAGARAVLGLNTRNRENDLRSGHWAGLELAIGRRVGPVAIGVQAVRLQQIQDDRNNPFGASRYRSTQAGLFMMGAVPALGASVSLHHAATVSSRNALHGRFTQVRLTRTF